MPAQQRALYARNLANLAASAWQMIEIDQGGGKREGEGMSQSDTIGPNLWTQVGPNSVEIDATRCDETRCGSEEMPENVECLIDGDTQ
jgi:hypothetical protein